MMQIMDDDVDVNNSKYTLYSAISTREYLVLNKALRKNSKFNHFEEQNLKNLVLVFSHMLYIKVFW